MDQPAGGRRAMKARSWAVAIFLITYVLMLAAMLLIFVAPKGGAIIVGS